MFERPLSDGRRSRPARGRRASSALALIFAVNLAAANPSYATGKPVTFTGHFKGVANLLINNGSVSIPSVKGTGTASLVGVSTVKGKGTSSAAAQCDPFTGTGSIAGKAGKLDLTIIKSSTQGCSSGESGPVTVTFSGKAKATGGTGAAKHAAGTISFKGTLDLKGTSGSQAGTFSVSLTGRLSVGG
jgi:hypothetical protein